LHVNSIALQILISSQDNKHFHAAKAVERFKMLLVLVK